MSQSGKQTLLRRLEGKDPFADDGDDHHDDDRERTEAIVPYQPPPENSAWKAAANDRIQLSVKISRSVPPSSSQTTQLPLDFAVLLINPSHDQARIRDHLNESLTALLHLQGHHKMSDKKTSALNDTDDSEESKKVHVSRSESGDEIVDTRPFCLCLLLNFRDRKDMVRRKKASKHRRADWLESSDVQRLTMQILQDYPTLEPDRLVLQCGESSLVNCYGLDLLHHFIYKAYLQRKRYDLEAMLSQIHQARLNSQGSSILPYDEFIELIKQQQQQNDQSKKGEQRNSEASTTPKKIPRQDLAQRDLQQESSSPRRKVMSSDLTSPVANLAGASPTAPKLNSQHSKEQLLPSPATSPVTPVQQRTTYATVKPHQYNPKATLEEFLASDSDDDAGGRASPQRRQYTKVASIPYDGDGENEDDEDEEDFFYDESGTRQSSRIRYEKKRLLRASQSSSATKEDSTTSPVIQLSISKTEVSFKASEASNTNSGRNTSENSEAADSATRNKVLSKDVTPVQVNAGNIKRLEGDAKSQVPMIRSTEPLQAAEESTPKRQDSKIAENVNGSSMAVVVEKKEPPQKNGSLSSSDPADEDKDVARSKSNNRHNDDGSKEADTPTREQSERIASITATPEVESPEKSNNLLISTQRGLSFVESSDEEESERTAVRSKTTLTKKCVDEEDDDEEFFIGSFVSKSSKLSTTQPRQDDMISSAKRNGKASLPLVTKMKENASAPTTSGLSAAALAAIAAAKEQAEMMLQQQENDEMNEPVPKVKKKSKDSDKKILKKEKKSKRSSAD